MKKTFVFVLSLLIAFSALSCMKVNTAGFNLSTQPHIANIPAQKMIIAQAKGTPEQISGKCIGSLYQVYFALKFKGKMMEAPRGRWPVMEGTPVNEWTGIFGMPIPDEVTSLPVMKRKLPVEVTIGTWEYGETAEILHNGSYDTEKADVDMLMKYIADNGYAVNGMHEEIYIKGPGMFGKGNPDKYETLIRYPVKKAEAPKKKEK